MRWIIMLVIIVAIVIYLANRQEAPKPAPQPEPTPVAQSAPPAPPAPQIDRMELYRQAAQAAGVELRGVEPAANGALVSVAWVGDVASLGGDFIEQCVRRGAIRDFDENAVKMGLSQEDGRQVHTAQYTVRY